MIDLSELSAVEDSNNSWTTDGAFLLHWRDNQTATWDANSIFLLLEIYPFIIETKKYLRIWAVLLEKHPEKVNLFLILTDREPDPVLSFQSQAAALQEWRRGREEIKQKQRKTGRNPMVPMRYNPRGLLGGRQLNNIIAESLWQACFSHSDWFGKYPA